MDRFLTRRRTPAHRKRRPDDRRLVSTTTSSSDDVLLVQKLLRALPLPWPELSRICRGSHHQPNLLYRSDSFKFERFQPPHGQDQLDVAPSQISLRDEYSVPIDLIAHSRPDALLDTNTRWLTGKRYGQTIQIIDTYSDPRDSKTYLQPAEDDSTSQKIYYTNTTRDYSLPYTDYSSPSDSQKDEDNNDNDCDVIKRSRRLHPRPVAGRFEKEEEEEDASVDNSHYSSAHKRRTRPAGSSGRHHSSRKGEAEEHRRYEKEYAKSTCGRKGRNEDSKQEQFNSEQRRRTPYYYGDLLSAADGVGSGSASASTNPMPPHQVLPPSAASASNPALPPPSLSSHPTLMSRLYETAFDCRVSRSDDELEVDLVTHRSLLQSSPSTQSQLQSQSQLPISQLQSQLPVPQKQQPVTRPVTSLHHHRLHSQRHHNHHHHHHLPSTRSARRDEDDEQEEMLGQELSRLGLSGCPPSAPASAPLPAKFPSAHTRAPSSHHNHRHHHSRLKDIRLPVKSLRSRANDSRALEGRPDDKNRPSSKAVEAITVGGARPKYSSSESMATTSSSGGSLESIRSSTSDGNRSTTSSDSQASSSLSSHSSDNRHSASTRPIRDSPLGLSLPLTATASRSLHLQHILSPISDKSGHEQNSETSDNNRNNNSQGTPDDVTGGCTPTSVVGDQLTMGCVTVSTETSKASKSRRTTSAHAQNRNVARLAPDAEVLQAGSDSGISIECPPTLKPDASQLDLADLPFDMPKLRRRRLQQLQQVELSSGDMSHDKSRRKPQSPQQATQSLDLSHLDSGSTTSVDLRDLPFDMPKLRRRAQSQQADDNSGSTTSVDLRDLPFDMPKLRRRQRMSLPVTTAMTAASSSGAASSSHSVQDSDHIVSRPSLTLDLDKSVGRPSCSNLSLRLELDETSSAALGEAVDVNVPLEKQGWYHGVITRLEAETVLRSHREGSYLVRNSESSRNDYSLSLKSARGFMHMRIQLCTDSGKYILGQFSSPFATIPDMIQNYTVNRLPIRGAEHMCLLHPVIEQLL